MSVLKGTLSTSTITTDKAIDLSNATFIHLVNNGSLKVILHGNIVLNAGSELKYDFGFVSEKQRLEVVFENAVGTKNLFVAIGRASSKCSCK